MLKNFTLIHMQLYLNKSKLKNYTTYKNIKISCFNYLVVQQDIIYIEYEASNGRFAGVSLNNAHL